MRALGKEFYERDPVEVAKDLLGHLLVRRINKELLIGKIVETEAYYADKDPACIIAMRGEKWMRAGEILRGEVGRAFIYMVHGNWLLNIVAHSKNQGGAVLIRAIEPIEGIELMKKLRGERDLSKLTNGPGKLTKAMGIDKRLHLSPVYSEESELKICEGRREKMRVERSKRIGVKEDLEEELRFFIAGNKWVSKRLF